MDKQKQIEEMARIILVNCGECYTCKYKDELHCADLLSAEELYNAGYRKIPEGAVVLTREELKAHDKALVKKFAERLKETLENCSPIDGYDLEDLEFDGETIQECIDEICKEITEGV